MSLLEIVHHQFFPQARPLTSGDAPAASEPTDTVDPEQFDHLLLIDYQPAFDLLERAFTTCPTLKDEMFEARKWAADARALKRIPLSHAPMVQALLGLAHYVSGNILFMRNHLDEVAEVVNRMTAPYTASEEEILTNHLAQRWPLFSEAHSDVVEALVAPLADYCRIKGIQVYLGLIPPDEVIGELFRLIGIIEEDMPEAAEIQKEESVSPYGVFYRLRRQCLIPPRIREVQKLFRADLGRLEEKVLPVEHRMMAPQYAEANVLLPPLLLAATRIKVDEAKSIKLKSSEYTIVHRIVTDTGRVLIRKTYLKAIPSKQGPLIDLNFAERGILAEGLANTLRFSNSMGPDAPEIFAVDQTPGGLWRVYMEYCPHGDLSDYMRNPDHRKNPVDILGMAFLFLSLLARAEERGIHHRDIKLQNVFLRSLPDGKNHASYVLADYDHSIRMGELPLYGHHPYKVGTYMPPESKYKLGEPFKFCTGPTVDVYAAGACLWSLVTGLIPERPPNAQSVPLLNIQSVSGHALGPVIERATRTRPEKRYPSLSAMLEATEDAILSS